MVLDDSFGLEGFSHSANGEFLDSLHLHNLRHKILILEERINNVKTAGMLQKAAAAESALDAAFEVLRYSLEVQQRTAAELEKTKDELNQFAKHGRLNHG